jgi:hypothetical protein
MLERLFVSKLDEPFSNCLKDTTSMDSHESKYYKQILRKNLVYKRDICIDLILQNYVYENCGCVSSVFLNFFDFPYCSVIERVNCQRISVINFTSQSILKKESVNCPLECDSMEFKWNIMQASFPSDNYRRYLKRNPTVLKRFPNLTELSDDLIDSSVVAVKIYFNDMKYTRIVEKSAMNTLTFISNIGGILGLFLGLSLLSLVEIIELFLQIILIFFENNF